MRRLTIAAAALTGLAVSASSASAQHYRNVIRNSGNGSNNAIIARNGPAIPLYAPPALSPGYAANYAPASYPQAGYAPAYELSYSPGHAPTFGGVSRNVIRNSIVARSGGFGFGGSFPGGVNVNVVTNSANGVGNSILAGNGQPGGLNLNIITNSGNGVGNSIITRNR